MRFVLLCAVTLTANVAVNAVAWKCLKQVQAAMEVAFVFATGVSASLNFLGMKHFVFKGSGPKEGK